MMRRKQYNDVFSQEFARLKFIGLDWPTHERDIQSPGEQAGGGFNRVLAVQHQSQMRQAFRDERTQGRKNTNVGSGKCSD